MKCGYCNGTGEHINDANRMTTCEFCDGTGVIKSLTNEEWIHTLNTEQLAEILVYMAEDKSEAKTVHKENVGKCVWWLKQPHKENV